MNVSCGTCGTRTPPPRPTCRNRLCRWYGQTLPRQRLRTAQPVSLPLAPLAPGQFSLGRLFLLMLAGAALLAMVRDLGWTTALAAGVVLAVFRRREISLTASRAVEAVRSNRGVHWLRALCLAAYLALFAILLYDALRSAVGTPW